VTNVGGPGSPDVGTERLLLLDGHSLAYRAFYALPVDNFSTTTGQPTNAVYGFTSMLINALRDEAPTHIAVAFDLSRQTFRTTEFPEYKATRAASPAEFAGQIALIRDVLAAMSIAVLDAEGFEADDVIATLATEASAAGFEVAIISGDRDVFQLVDDKVTVLYPKKGVSDLARMTPQAVEEKYGLSPAQYPDFAALRGDPSDNLPNIPGVGEKTASKWIREFGSLQELVARVDEVPGKAGVALREHLDQVVTNRRLTELVRTVPLGSSPQDLARTAMDRATVHEVFDALQFRVLRERLFAILGGDVASSDTAGSRSGREVSVSDDLVGWLSTRSPDERLGVEVSGHWGAGTGEVTLLAAAGADGTGAWCAPSSLSPSAEASIADWLADPRRPKALHDAKGPLLASAARGWAVRGMTADTALSAYVVLPGQRSFDLGDLTARFLGRDLATSSADGGQLTLDGDDDERRAADLVLRADAVRELADVLDAELTRKGGSDLVRDVELPLEHVLMEMERVGIAVDSDYLRGLEDEFARAARAAEEEAVAIVGRPFNLGSPKQLQEILFGERGLPKTKRIKTGYTTDADALAWLAATTEDPLPPVLMRWRDVSRLRQTVAGLVPLVDDHGRIHTTYNQLVAATGRLSSQEPNLQNIPIRTEEGARIRNGFVAGPGYEFLLTADYSQIEMRIMAHLSEDEGLIAAFHSGEDLHTTVGSRVFGVPPEEVTPEMRRRIKAMSYGLVYGLSAFGLSQQLGIDTDEARALMDEYFARFGGVRDYLARSVDEARVTGYTETLLGRRRYLPDLTSDVRPRREIAERMALNAPIQGSASDVIKVAMLRVAAALEASELTSRLLLQVHDELVLEVAPGERDQVDSLVREQMGAAYPLSVPLVVSVGVGRSWQDAGH